MFRFFFELLYIIQGLVHSSTQKIASALRFIDRIALRTFQTSYLSRNKKIYVRYVNTQKHGFYMKWNGYNKFSIYRAIQNNLNILRNMDMID